MSEHARRAPSPGIGIRARFLWLAAFWIGWSTAASALHVVSEDIPDGVLRVPPGGRASLSVIVNPNDTMQWTWNEQLGVAEELSTQLIWTDAGGNEHALAPAPAGQTFGSFEAPKELVGARLEWRNGGTVPHAVVWSYYTTASFWRRPGYLLPAMLPLFLLAGAFYFGGVIDRRRGPQGPGWSIPMSSPTRLPGEIAS